MQLTVNEQVDLNKNSLCLFLNLQNDLVTVFAIVSFFAAKHIAHY